MISEPVKSILDQDRRMVHQFIDFELIELSPQGDAFDKIIKINKTGSLARLGS